MQTSKHRVKGLAEKLAGRIKQRAGRASGDRELMAEGRGQQAIGETRETAARSAGRLRGKLRQAGGGLEQKLNRPRRRPPPSRPA